MRSLQQMCVQETRGEHKHERDEKGKHYDCRAEDCCGNMCDMLLVGEVSIFDV